jgi:hypothetical protein
MQRSILDRNCWSYLWLRNLKKGRAFFECRFLRRNLLPIIKTKFILCSIVRVLLMVIRPDLMMEFYSVKIFSGNKSKLLTTITQPLRFSKNIF